MIANYIRFLQAMVLMTTFWSLVPSHAESTIELSCADPKPLSLPGASKLAQFNAKMEQHDRAHRECSFAVEDYCARHLHPAIARSDLESIFKQMIKDARTRMPNPRSACAPRAKIIQKWLADFGYKSQILIIKAPTIVGVFENAAYVYADHVVPTVAAAEPNGILTRYVLDPQFMDAPMSETDYLRAVTGGHCEFLQTPPNTFSYSHCIYFRSVGLHNSKENMQTLRSNPDVACDLDIEQALEALSGKAIEQPVLRDSDPAKLRARAINASLAKSRRVLEDAVAFWIKAGNEIQDKTDFAYQYAEMEKAKAVKDIAKFDQYRANAR